jgi:hypothetical protein
MDGMAREWIPVAAIGTGLLIGFSAIVAEAIANAYRK